MKKSFNYFLFFIVVFLVGFGFLFLACLSAPGSLQRFGNTNYFFLHQFYSLLAAIALGFAAYKCSLRLLKKWAPFLVLANILAIFATFIPGFGFKAGGATRWISIAGFSFQPSEFLKITAVLYISALIASKLSEDGAPGWKSIAKRSYHNIIYILVPFIIFLGLLSFALIFQRDLSTLGIIGLTLLVLYFSAKTPLWHTISVIIAGAGYLLFMIVFEPYRWNRLSTFLHPDADPLGKGYQLKQSLISLGSGGVFGNGLGMSTQKFGFLPEAMTDSIFAIIGEEIGAIGCIALIAVFILFFWQGIKIARNSPDRFSKMTAVGITFWITFQAFINISSVSGIFPLAGIPLPFFSYGGSHIAAELIGVGLLLNISKNT